ncbi:LYR motif-containing [Chlorella sorokiniana]|uniref:LYR motif-containing n=1 Tax=Chlorella sorokiniana TaxID=3076 RepID=A0A2P6TWY6_CHLSO|nr:LYR motif-containing [Chlorella sorokiniana]|eukprot:PRW58567.1 LYR motif-containing [Chlorella sorokiniana]
MSQHRSQVLRAYRELLGLVRRLPEGQRASALAEARQAMRQHAAEPAEDRQQELFKQLVAKVSFLRVVTPRLPGEVSSIGTGHYVMRDGKLVEGAGRSAGARVADGTISMDEARQRHQQLLQRQHFGREPPPYNPASF